MSIAICTYWNDGGHLWSWGNASGGPCNPRDATTKICACGVIVVSALRSVSPHPPAHFVSASCAGEKCRCGAAATHKLAEEIPHDDPMPRRHPLTAYVCCDHFAEILGSWHWRKDLKT